ncbi:MAG: ROK family protein [Candidatus Nanohaloarchaea archaeon]
MKPFLGIDIGSTNLRLVIGDENGFLSDIRTEKVSEFNSGDEICSLIEDFLEHSESKIGDIESIGICAPGNINVEEQVIMSSTQMDSIDFKVIERKLGKKVHLENDANAAALGLRYFAEPCCDNLAVLIIGTGIGCGIIYNGRLLETIDGRSPEIGFACLGDRNWHEMSGGGNIPEYASDYTGRDEVRFWSTKEIFDKSHQNREIENFLKHLKEINGRGLATLSEAYALQKIVVTGGLATKQPEFIENSFKAAEEFMVNETPEMKISEKDNLGLYGSLALNFQN